MFWLVGAPAAANRVTIGSAPKNTVKVIQRASWLSTIEYSILVKSRFIGEGEGGVVGVSPHFIPAPRFVNG